MVPPVIESVQASPQIVQPTVVPVIVQPQSLNPLASQPSLAPSSQPISTQETRAFDAANTIRSQPASVVVEIPQPWEERSRWVSPGNDTDFTTGDDILVKF